MAPPLERANPVLSARPRGSGIAPRVGMPRHAHVNGDRDPAPVIGAAAARAAEARGRRSRRPQLPSLLVTRETAIIRAVRGVAHREEIPLDVCENADDALELLSTKSYRTMLVDLDMTGAAHLLHCLHHRAEPLPL